MGIEELPPATPVRVLIIGGCYAGIAAAVNLLDLCTGRRARNAPAASAEDPDIGFPTAVEITIVDERDGYFHLIGSPLALASQSYTEKAWVKFTDVAALQAPNVRVLQGRATTVNCGFKSATVVLHGSQHATSLSYDYLIVASGLRRVWPVVPQSLSRETYLKEAGDQIKAVAAAPFGVVIVGGGAVGVEMAAELKLVQPQTKVTLVHSHSKLLSSEPLPDETKDVALELTKEAGVDVLLEHRLDKATEVVDADGRKRLELSFTNGHTMPASEYAMAVSRPVPSTEFLPSSALDEGGYVKIKATLDFPDGTANANDHFAAGDLVRWSGIKRCGGAMHMGFIAATNVHQRILQEQLGQQPKLMELPEIPPMIGLAVGKKAVAYSPDQGTVSGENIMQAFFGDDLGFSICWKWMKLGEKAC